MRIRIPAKIGYNASDFKQYSIQDIKRDIILFVDRQAYEMGSVLYGNAIQINISAQTGFLDSEVFSVGVDTRNNATIKMNVYLYSVIFDPVLGIKNLLGASFILQNAFSTENIENYDTKTTSRPFICVYDKNFCSDQSRVMDVRDLFFNTSALPLPIYYTMEHQRREEKEGASIIWFDSPIEYEGQNLIDQYTKVTIMDKAMWD